MPTHAGYTAGWNMPGYMPEVDPEHFDTFTEAVAYLVDTVTRFWDDDYESAEGSDARLLIDERWLPVHTGLHNAGFTHDDGTHTFAASCDDGHLAFWITPVATHNIEGT